MSINLALLFTSTDAKKALNIKERQYEHKDKEVRDLLSKEYFTTINTRPVYQRDPRWELDNMNSFIDSVFKQRYIQPILMYKLHPEDLTSEYNGCDEYEYEVMDGQHRLYTLNAFRSATLHVLPHISKKPFIVHWVIEVLDDNGYKNKNYVFYKETEDVINWCRETGITPQFLPKEGKKFFDNTNIKLTTITSKLTMHERSEEFMSLQNGVPVRNSDYYKNMTCCTLIDYLQRNNTETLMKQIFFSHCSKQALNFWTQWVCRCFLLFKRFKEGDTTVAPVSETFLFRDTEINKNIESNHTNFNPSEEVLGDFYNVFKGFIEFLKNLSEDIEFNPTQIFAIFYHLCDETRNIGILSSHMAKFSKAGKGKNLWVSKKGCNNEMRRTYFNECVEELKGMIELAIPIDKRPITGKIKNEVWKKCVDGKCVICKETKIKKKTFEVGHIVARSLGGKMEIDNLLPMCFDCNRSMGTRNALEYKKDTYPFTY